MAKAQVKAAQNVEDKHAHAMGQGLRRQPPTHRKTINTAAMKQVGREAIGNAIGTVAAAGAYTATKPKAAVAITQWEPGSEGRWAVYEGASGGPNGNHIRDNGDIY